MTGRSIIEAWFVGTHVDMGGGAHDDGLSLYPLQWMLVECRTLGLVLEHSFNPRSQGLIENPLQLTRLEKYPSEVSNETSQKSVSPWAFTLQNGIEVKMYDLRAIHKHGNLQQVNVIRKKSQDGGDPTHMVKLNTAWKNINLNGSRWPFESKFQGKLTGYQDHGE